MISLKVARIGRIPVKHYILLTVTSTLQNQFEALPTGPRDMFGNQHSKATVSEQTVSQVK